MFNKAKLSEKDREKWSKVFISDMMSSEESDSEEDCPIVVRPLPWRAPRVDNFFKTMDKYNNEYKSPQARHQTKDRVLGPPNTRSPPVGKDVPNWALIDMK